jgi:UDP-N-acetylmuramate--alanine ligase
VTSEDLVAQIRAAGHTDARFVEAFDAAEAAIVSGAKAGDLVLTMGAGDVTRLSDRLVKVLGQ